MRLVRLTVIYDMDDDTKPLEAELSDWINGRVAIVDLGCSSLGTKTATSEDGATITIEEASDGR